MNPLNFFHSVRSLPSLVTAALLAGSMTAALAQSPSKPLTIVVGYAAGGSADYLARVIADKLAAPLGRPVIVDNKPGAGGRVAAGQVKSMPADGSVVMLTVNPLVVQSIVNAKTTNFDLLTDFVPIANMVSTPLAVVVPVTSPIKNVRDLIEYSKTHKKDFGYGTSGAGGIGHLSAERLGKATHLDWTHIPYKGGSLLSNDLLGGHVQVGVDALGDFMEFHRAGKIRVLATFSPERSPLAPDLPTLAEQGVNDANTELWYGLLAPAKTPAAVVTQIQNAVAKALEDPEVVARLSKIVARIDYLPSAQFGQRIKHEFDVWRPVVRDAGVAIN